MAQTAVDLTLSTLRDLLVEEVKFLSGVGWQVKDVQTELRRMQAFLEDVDRKKYDDPNIDNYVKEIRDLCYRIEDVVETYATDVVLQKREGEAENIIDFLNRITGGLCRCFATHEVGTEINSIKKSISSWTQSLMNYGFIKTTLGKEKSGGVDGNETWLRKTYGLGVKKDFVGREKDINFLVGELLNGDSSTHNVVSIWGMGGLGKTTLAQKVYWDKEIRSGFKAFAWVCVSQDCKPKNVFQDLLEKLCQRKKETTDGMGDSALVQEVYEAMRKQKCLVVLDDLWQLDHWRCLRPAFPAAEANSKILITTRKESLAKIGFFHALDFLSENEAWELLRKKAFARTSPEDLREEPKTFEPLGRQIVHKCGYLPLAILVIGGILSKNNSLDAWEEVNNKIGLYLRRADDSEEDGNIKQVLSLSYDDLPFHLKPCFLYLSRYQEDENIRADELYSMWMAEGIVSPKNQEREETLMDVAKQYLRRLAGRSMVLVEVDEIFAPEEILSCRLHDLVRELCLAKSVEEEFSNLVDFRGGKRPSLSPSYSNGYLRRLAMYVDLNVDGVSLTGESTQKLRSLSLHAPPHDVDDDDVLGLPQGLINVNLKFLRVLKFYGVAFPQKELLSGIGNMVHLRYLGFEQCSLDELPSCIGELPSLQTLELIDFLRSPRMPNVLWKIKRLKCLYIPYDVKVEGKLALSGLDELEILYGFDSRWCETTELSKLKSLRHLKANIYENAELSKFIDCIEADGMCLKETIVRIAYCEFTSVEGMSILRKLFVSRSIRGLTLYKVLIGKLPEYEPGFLPRLTTLDMWGVGLLEDPMGTLEKLPKLRELILRSYLGKKIVCNARGFPQLRSLALYYMHNLETWKVEEGAMPRLSFLGLSWCYRLDMMPDGIRFITSLQTLEIGVMPPEFRKRVEEGGEDYDKVHHINSIKFNNKPWRD